MNVLKKMGFMAVGSSVETFEVVKCLGDLRDASL